MLDINRHNCRKKKEREKGRKQEKKEEKSWDSLSPDEKQLKRKKGRYYHALLSGLQWNRNEDLYFLTLTSKHRDGNLEKFWHFLVGFIRYHYGSFEYIKQETSEGNGVLHIVFAGPRLDVNIIRAYWKSLTDAPQMKLKRVTKNKTGKLEAYLLNQYLNNQNGFMRFSCSRGWLFPGYRTAWKNLIKHRGYAAALVTWKDFMALHQIPGQVTLGGITIETPSEKRQYRRERRALRLSSK